MKLLDKRVVLFFLVRCIGVFMGLITIAYQYQFTYELKQFFHQYIFLSLFVYLIDGGYSEKITQNNAIISTRFLHKTTIVFIACVVLSLVSYYYFTFNHIYLKWLLASSFIIPFQMYADALYRIILQSKQSLSFVVYQALSPTIILLLLITSKNFMQQNNLWFVFVVFNMLIQIVYLLYIYLVNKKIFQLSNERNHNKLVEAKALMYKLFPLIVYEAITIIYNQNNFNSNGFGLELIRSCYFIVGFLLLMIYTKSNAIFVFINKTKMLGIVGVITFVSLGVCLAIAASKYVLFKTIPIIFSIDITIYFLMIALYSVYVFKYCNWVFIEKNK